MSVTAHCLIKNEENFIWYAIMSVLPYVDEMIVFDAGSTDKTVSIIKKILKTKEGKKKIHFEERGDQSKQGHTDLRNEMIKMTKTDWFMILDGDEVWPKNEIKYLLNEEISFATNLKKHTIMVGYHLCSQDIFHYTESGHFFTSWGYHGHFTYRVFKRYRGIHWEGEYLKDRLCYSDQSLVASRENIFHSTAYFWHLSKLPRSSKDSKAFFRKKPSKLNFFPYFLRRFFVKKITFKVPDILHED